MNYKKHVKHILRQIEKAFDKADSIKEYEEVGSISAGRLSDL